MGLLTFSEVYSIIFIIGSVMACRHTWCWKKMWEFYFWILRQQKENGTLSVAWASETSKLAPRDTFLLTRHISFNKATSTTTGSYLLIVSLPMGLWAHFYSNHHTRAMWSLIEAVVQGAHRQASSQADNQTGSWGSLLWVLG